jgi:hypothetical protein
MLQSWGVESHTLRQHNRYASCDLRYWATARAQRNATTRTHQYGHKIHSIINKMVYFNFNFILYLLDKHLHVEIYVWHKSSPFYFWTSHLQPGLDVLHNDDDIMI